MAKTGRRIPADLLFQNVVALVTWWNSTGNEGGYNFRQVSLGMQDEKLVEMAISIVKYGERRDASANHVKASCLVTDSHFGGEE